MDVLSAPLTYLASSAFNSSTGSSILAGGITKNHTIVHPKILGINEVQFVKVL